MPLNKRSQQNNIPQDAHWIPLADLMTGLMMVFLFISIAFMVKIQNETKQIRDVAKVYDKTKTELLLDLRKEFAQDLKLWDAEIDNDSTVRFKSPDVLFDTGSGDLKQNFKNILNTFFPRYINILSSNKYKKNIEEIRIEGHTSSIWNLGASENNAYFANMELSQKRTRSVLQYVLNLYNKTTNILWLKQHLTANGLSSSKLIYKNGKEDAKASQRVEFRIKTNAEDKINQILLKDI